MQTLPDHRCSGLPDKPYSSYCRVCWYPIYTLWFTKDDHEGACMHGKTVAADCEEACNRARSSIAVQKLRDAGLWPNASDQRREASAALALLGLPEKGD
ncbi:hypothetical protein [Nevskia sp.]|uniref:hypothetical protein n=1 Tax=Nevskia sp. TaxID=1929292 RepID=UPI002600DDFC|nr:hypothetical protein [Nevskia sp.]